MSDSKISALTAVSVLAATDEFVVVDKSDTSQAASGTTKRVTATDAGVVATAWTAVTFAGAWVDSGAPNQVTQYRKIGDRVELRGLPTSGAAGSTIFTLPVGFRPPATLTFPTAKPTNFWFTIDSAGAVQPSGGSGPISVNCSFSTTA